MTVYTKTPEEVFAPTDAGGAPRGIAPLDAAILTREMVNAIEEGDEALSVRVTTAEADIDTLATDVAAVEADIVDIQADIATLEGLGATGIKWKSPVAVVATSNVTLSGEQTIDGVLTSSSRILVAGQSAGAENGPYVTGAGAWTRATDADTADEIAGSGYYVEGGTANTATSWALSTPAPITLGTTALTFVKVAGIDQTALEELLAGVDFDEVPDESEFAYAVVDENDLILFGVRWDGTFYAPKQELGEGVVGLDNLSTALQTQLSSAGGGFAQNADYFVMGDADDDGNFQITSQRRADGQAFALTSTNSNSVDAIDADDIVYFTEYVSGVGTRKYIPAEGGTAYRTISAPTISWWGDSLTTNDYGGGEGVTDRVATALGVTVNMEGVSGERSDEIKTRMLAATSQHEDTTIIWCGTNNRSSNTFAATVVADVQAMVAILKPLGKRYLVIGALNGEADTTGTDNYNRTVITINGGLETAYPDHFFDVRAFLRDTGTSGAFDLAGVTPSSQDTTDIAAGIVPLSWRTDTVHLNEAGKAVVAEKIEAILTDNGWY